MAIKCISHNVKGFNTPQKRKKAFSQYKQLGAKIILLQETHFSQASHPKYFDRNFPQAFCSLHTSKSRGAAIFLHSSLNFVVQQVYKDKDSRFVVVKGLLHNRECTIASVYAPNEAAATFFSSFFLILERFLSPHMIIGGDFNLVSTPSLDRSHVSSFSRAFPKSLSRRLTDLQLLDSWRALNVGAREFTFFSHPHRSYARLDYIFTTPVILANSSSADIHSCVWSDHHITSFSTDFVGFPPSAFTWRLNEALLSDPLVESEISKSIDSYFSINDIPETPISSIWVAHKAVLRGVFIKLATARKARDKLQIVRLSSELDGLYRDSKSLLLDSTRSLIEQKRLELDTLLSAKTEKALRWAKAKFLLHSNAASTIFARELNQSFRPPHSYKLSSLEV